MEGTDQQVAAVEEALMKEDLIVISMGAPVAAQCPTNLLKVHRLGGDSVNR